MPKIGRDALVVIIGLDIFPAMAIIAGGVVHQNGRRSEPFGQCRKSRSQRIDVAKIASFELDGGALGPKLTGKRLATLGIEVDHADASPLFGKRANGLFADPGSPAGEKYDGILKTWVTCERHRLPPFQTVSASKHDVSAPSRRQHPGRPSKARSHF